MESIRAMHRGSGFTLLEMVVVITIIGILSGLLLTVLRGPMRIYVDTERRARLVDIADTALLRMAREIRLALPNSVRVSGGNAIEFLRTLEGGRYRAEGDGTNNDVCAVANPDCGGGADDDRLDFNAACDCFEVLGVLSAPPAGGGNAEADCMSGSADCIVIYNTGQSGANAYQGDNIAAVFSAAANAVTFKSGATPPFPFASPRQRFYLVDTPVSFVCSANRITRHADYGISAVQSNPPVGGNENVLAEQVTGCSFSYLPGTESRAGLATLQLTVTDPELGESVTLLQQVHVGNQP